MRPTIALCLITKNEAHNLGPLLNSVKGCFDEIHITDTGSTDNTLGFIEAVNKAKWPGMPEIKIHHFEWVNDFSKARNYAFSHTNADYVMWLDGDDKLVNTEAFIEWRDTVMHSAHYWVANYNYAFNDQGGVECKFIRERVIKNNYGFKWKYFVHEGLVQTEGKHFWPNKVNSWWVDHMRTDADKKADDLRNVKLFEAHDYDSLEPRMKFYYGKELFENGQQTKAGKPLLDALREPSLEPHDRILSFQYAAQSANAAKQFEQAIDICMNGLRLFPGRAEYWCLIGDARLALGQLAEARLAFKVALNCSPDTMGGIVVTYLPAYGEYPHIQLAQIALNMGDFDGAWASIEALKAIAHPSVGALESNYHQLKELSVVRSGLPKVDDIIITCPPFGAVTDWDENTLASKGHGGSETAAIEVARLLHEKTGRPVKVFQPRVRRETMPSGVEYIPVQELKGYIQNVEPSAHIPWRHAVRLTRAPSFVWSHDLLTPGADRLDQYDKIFALSGFHKDYLHQCMRIPKDKIELLFNGINASDYTVPAPERNPLKVIFSSSPDRGLDRAIRIVEKAREISGLDIELHSFYGFENMKKGGLKDMAEMIERMIAERPYVKHHGFVNKRELMAHFQTAGVWVYPANFIETYCITAIEALCAGTWPIVRDMGALKYTMKEAIEKGMCEVLHTDCESEAEVAIWAHHVVEAIIDQKWKRVSIDPKNYSWGLVADAMLKEFGLDSCFRSAV
jgi:glycosyltransferase involved in cell wall biosynthesis